MEILNIKGLTFKYPNTDEPAVKDASFSVESGSFNLLCGISGCGKTTLLKLLKPAVAPSGKRSGDIFFSGRDIYELSERESASEIGFVAQNTEDAIVTDTVWRELAFGLENLEFERDEIRRRVAETASFFGMEDIYFKRVNELSGGQKQLLSLASVMVMQPKILILDEPTSKLDPINASSFISAVKKINTELGVTVIIAEHRLEELIPISDSIIYMDGGSVKTVCPPSRFAEFLQSEDGAILHALPVASRLFSALGLKGDAPLTVNGGRAILETHLKEKNLCVKKKEYTPSDDVSIHLSSVYFRYSKNAENILSSADLSVYKGERFFILGGNGAGKTTLLKVISGLLRPYKGKIEIEGKSIKEYKSNSLYKKTLAFLPQDPLTLFTKTSIKEDMLALLDALSVKKEERESKIADISERLGVSHLLSKHPCDLSGGELQKCALAKVLLTQPRIILLDEPTKGLDIRSKENLAKILCELSSEDITSVTVSHDLEFAAENASRCAILFAGEVVSPGIPQKFFSDNCFYTTSTSRMSRGIVDGAVTADELISICRSAYTEEQA